MQEMGGGKVIEVCGDVLCVLVICFGRLGGEKREDEWHIKY